MLLKVNILKYLSSNVEFILIGLFAISLFIQLLYYLILYSKFLFHKKEDSNTEQKPVSVIICARNEAENLDQNLPAILTQEYPNYEVIVVNDCSNDHTDEILGKYLKEFKHLRTTNISEDKKFSHGKKLALTIGIKAAKNEILVLTDADCEPASNQWLARIQQNFTSDKSIVLGYGGYKRRKSLLNNYVRYDTLTIALQYFSYAVAGNPYMGVGRNLAYRKSLFFENKGFANHYHLLSGDDDLFINETATGTNTAVEFSSESHTRSEAEQTLKDWIKQKRRHLTTSSLYKFKHKFLLGGEVLSRFVYYASFAVLVSAFPISKYIMGAFGLRFLVQLLYTKKTMKLLSEKNLLVSSLFYDIFSLFINFILFISNRFRFKRRRQWK